MEIIFLAFLSYFYAANSAFSSQKKSSELQNGAGCKVRVPEIFKCNYQTLQNQKKTYWNPKEMQENSTFLKKSEKKNENHLLSVFTLFLCCKLSFQQSEKSSDLKDGAGREVRVPKIFKRNYQTLQNQTKTYWNPKGMHENWTFLKKSEKKNWKSSFKRF